MGDGNLGARRDRSPALEEAAGRRGGNPEEELGGGSFHPDGPGQGRGGGEGGGDGDLWVGGDDGGCCCCCCSGGVGGGGSGGLVGHADVSLEG